MDVKKEVLFHCKVEYLQEEMRNLCLSVKFIGKPVGIEILFCDENISDVLGALSKTSYKELQSWLESKSADGGLIISGRLDENPVVHKRIDKNREYCEYREYEGIITIIPFCLKSTS